MYYKYETVCTSARKENEGALSYGVKIIGADGDTFCMATGISDDMEKVDKLVELCNGLELEPIHFYDVISDFLTSEKAVI